MNRTKGFLCALLCVGVVLAGNSAWADNNGKNKDKRASNQPAKSGQLKVASQAKPHIDYARVPLNFEPNLGQSNSAAKFIAKSRGYNLKLDSTGALFQFNGHDKEPSASVRMDLVNANRQPAIAGESPLPGKADYFPTGDPKSWITNVPTYSQVHYSGVYPGVDVSFYGTSNLLEYDFLVQPGSDANQVRMKISGSNALTVSGSGDLLVPAGKRDLHFLKPVAYQLASDETTRIPVDAAYKIEKNAGGESVVAFSLGKYDHTRQLVIDPVVDALSFSEYLNEYYVGAVTVDSSGNSYVTGQVDANTTAFYVDKFSSTGALVYTAAFGSGNQAYPYAIAVDSNGLAYVTGQVYTSGTTVPATSSAYQATPGTANQEIFMAVLSASGASLNYCTYLSGQDNTESNSIGLALDSSAKVYIGGHTYSTSFPTTTGAYQTANPSGVEIGFVAKFDPTQSGAASLIYSTLLGSTTNNGQQVNRIAVDYAGNAYVAAQGANGYPVTTGAFQYNGIDSAYGGAYVTKLNPTGTALVYSAYLGYGGASGIAIDDVTSGTPSAYVAGWVSDPDFPTTAGAYQTSYASGFALKMSGDGSTEIYSTFLSGPSGYNDNAVDQYPTLAVPLGCTSSCNAYITGRTNSPDFPTINPIQSYTTQYSAFVVELNSTGSAALFSSYLSGYTTQVYRTIDSQSFGVTPAIAVDGSGNIFVAGNTTSGAQNSDFPTTIPYPLYNSQAFLAKISGSATAGFTYALPNNINFGSQPVGIQSTISTVHLSNYSGAPVTGLTIQTTPSVFSESDNCNGTIAAGGSCSLNVTFTPTAPNTRNGTITITSNASNSPTTVTLTGTGYDTGYIAVSPASLTFPAQTVGTTSSAQTLTITNMGDETTSVSFGVNGNNNFAILNNCPSQLVPGAGCTASVTFSPSQSGLYGPLNLSVYSSNGPGVNIQTTGTGIISGTPTGLTVSSSYQFNAQTVNTTSGAEQLYYTNTGAQPIVIYSFTASGNFNVQNYGSCGTPPFTFTPQSNCYINITFSPTTAGNLTGTLAVSDDISGSPQLTNLSGLGIASTQTIEFYPSSAVSFPDTPQGSTSGIQTIYLENIGTAALTVDRTSVTGDFFLSYSSCEANVLQGTLQDGDDNAYTCQVNVQFKPTATGSRTGTLSFIDSVTGSPQVVNLSGTGTTATGALGLDPSAITFGPQPQGVTSGYQYIYAQNAGNSPVTITGATLSGNNSTDYSNGGSNCGALPYTLAPSQTNCYFQIQFTPGGTGTRTATFTIASSAGNQGTAITGTGVAATQAIGLTPTSLNLGSIVEGQSGNYEGIYLRNTGSETVSFTANATITGTNAGDFSLSTGCANNGNTLSPTQICYVNVRFSPSTTGAESATLNFTDSAGTQTFALSGTGVTTTPTYTTSVHALAYPTQVVGTTSATSYYTYFYNNGSTSVTLGNATVTGSFLIPHGYDTCSGQTIGAGSNCYVYVSFAPTAAGYLTGTLTFYNSSGTALTGAPVLPLAGYAVTATYSAFINPTSNPFVVQQVIGTTSGVNTVYLYNNGNTALTVGALSGTNFDGSGEFSDANDAGCNNATVQPNSYCQENITFTPAAAGTRTGTIVFPVTYANGSTASFTGNLSGVGIVEHNSAVLTPPSGMFIDQAVNTTSNYNVVIYLNNSGNLPFKVGALTNTNSSEFSTSVTGAYDNCSNNQGVQPGSNCNIGVRFTPSATGTRSGNITFPVTFADHTTTSLTVSFSGTGVAAAKTIAISPADLKFNTEIQTVTSPGQGLTVFNTGNSPVNISADTITTNSAEFKIYQDNCANTVVNPNSSCAIYINFTPSSSATGTQTGVLTINDNATGGPHTVTLSGIAITAAQQILIAPTSLAFGSLAAGSTSTYQAIYITNQGDSAVTVNSFALGGTNAAQFNIGPSSCSVGGTLNGHTTCYIQVNFAPQTGTTGAQSAAITETDTSATSTHTIGLTGTATAPGPAAAFNPPSLTFAKQNVGSSSAPQNFSVTNTGSANLVISVIASTNTTEFPIYNDGCSGTTLAPGAQCVSSVQFSPSLGGTRTGSIKVTDNAAGSPQVLALTGTGYGIPSATYSPSSLTFGNTNIGATSASQNITLSNPGTDTLNISGITVTGGNSSEFTQTNTCPASLAPAGSCVITVTFKPTASGTQSAYITVTDNANNIASSTQSVALTGTGVAVPTAGVSPTTLTFPSTDIGVNSAALISTVTNSGTGPLTITSIAISGTNASDYSQTNTCGSTLVAGSNCTISVTFKPSASGTRTATVTITDNAGGVSGTQQTISLTGTGAGLPAAALSPTSLTFTDQSVGTSSTAQTITLSNSGTGPLTIASIALSGTNSGDFSTTNNCSGSVATAGSCTISVTFKPTGVGSRTATLTVTDNAGNVSGSTQTASLSGTGIGIPAATPSPTSLTFSSQNVGTTSAAQTVTLTNGGTGVLTISSITITGTNSGDFSTTNNCSGSVAIGGNCAISVTFSPTAAGTRTGTLNINDNANNTASTQTVSLTGTGAGIPSATVTPSTEAFGNQNVGTTSASKTITLSNSGSAALTIASIAIGGTNAADFSTTNNCASTLAAASSCSIAVTFSPSAVGSRTATLTVTDNAGNVSSTTQTASLTGTGVGVAAAALSPTSLTFSDQNVGTASSAQTITLSNSGTAALTIAGIAISGTNASDYASTNNCSGSVAIGSSCTISVTFTPGAPGTRTGALTVTDNAGNVTGSTQTASLTGTGIGVPVAGVSPSSLTFTQTTGGTSAAQTVTVSNTGTGPLSITSIVIGGANSSDFAETTTCGSSLAANANCSISVTFTPASASSFSANLHVIDNSGNTGSTQTVTLAGTGTAGSAPAAGLSPSSLTFPLQTEGVTSSAQTLTLSNTGNATLTIASIAVGGTNAGDFAETNNCGTTLAASATCSISVTFDPTATGSRSATVVVTDNSGNVTGSTQTSTLSGTGAATATPGLVSLSPNSGSGLSQAFTAVYSDSSGASDLQSLHLNFNTSTSVTNACSVRYSPAANALYLYNNAGTGSSAALSPGSSSSVSNSQCTLYGTGSSATKLGNNLTVVYNITFSNTFTGSQNAYMSAINNSNAGTGYVQEGTWTPSGSSAPDAALSPSSLTFPLQTEGATSSAQTLTLSNTGQATLNIASIALGGTDPGDFAETNTCGTSLAAAATCTISVTFDPTTTGSRTATVVVTDNSGNVSGSTQTSTLTGSGAATATPGLVSLSPNSGSGLTQAFTAVYSDSSGASDLQSLHLTFNTSTSLTNACAVRYSPAANALYLYNNAGSGSSAALAPGSSSSVSNSQCTLNGTGSSVTLSGNDLTVVYNITFSSTFTGSQNAYMSAINNSNAGTGYVQEGTWTP